MSYPPFHYHIEGLNTEQKSNFDIAINTALKVREDMAEQRLLETKSLQKKLDSVTSENQQLLGKLKILEEELKQHKDSLPSLVKSAVEEKRRLDRALDKVDFKGNYDSLTNKEIKLKVIQSKMPQLQLDSISDEILEGAFLTVEELLNSEIETDKKRLDNFEQQINDLNNIFPLNQVDDFATEDLVAFQRKLDESLKGGN